MLRTLLASASLALLLAPPAAAQWVLDNHTDLLGVDDAEFTPDGRYVVIRDNTIATTAQVYDAGTGARVFSYQAMPAFVSGMCQDAVGVSDHRAIVIGSTAMIIDLDALTLLAEHVVGQDPRDVVVTPDGSFAALRGGDRIYVIELAGGSIVATAPGLPAEYAGSSAFDVDTVVADDEHAVSRASS